MHHMISLGTSLVLVSRPVPNGIERLLQIRVGIFCEEPRESFTIFGEIAQ